VPDDSTVVFNGRTEVKIEQLYYTSAWLFQCIFLCFTAY